MLLTDFRFCSNYRCTPTDCSNLAVAWSNGTLFCSFVARWQSCAERDNVLSVIAFSACIARWYYVEKNDWISHQAVNTVRVGCLSAKNRFFPDSHTWGLNRKQKHEYQYAGTYSVNIISGFPANTNILNHDSWSYLQSYKWVSLFRLVRQHNKTQYYTKTIDREFVFYIFFSFLKFNEFTIFFRLKKIRKKFVILHIIDVYNLYWCSGM